MMRRQSIPAVVAVSFLLLITATPIPVFGITLYLDDGGQHIFDDDSHKWDEVYLVQNIYHDPGTRLEISTDGWVKNLSAYNNSEVTFNGGSSVDKVSAFGRSTVTINTGHIGGDLLTEASITVHLKGGSVGGDLWAYGSGKLYNYGSDFEVNRVSAGSGSTQGYSSYIDARRLGGIITGALLLFGLGAVMVRRR